MADESAVDLVVTDYWNDGVAAYRRLHSHSVDEDYRDRPVDLEALVLGMVQKLGAEDGEAILLSVRRTRITSRHWGERRMRAVGPDSFAREAEDEVPLCDLLLRQEGRRLGRKVTDPLVVDRSVETPAQVLEGWDRRVVLLWEEDEVLRHDPDAVHLPQAVRRLCGCSVEELGPVLAKADFGDGWYDLHKDGWVTGSSYCGHSVGRLVTEEVKR